jgi:hypothetical protein
MSALLSRAALFLHIGGTAALAALLVSGAQAQGAWSDSHATLNPPTDESTSIAMVYDRSRSVTVLLASSGVTWEFDGGNWTQVFTGNLPSNCCTAMTYDAARGVVISHGGFNSTQPVSTETWEYDGDDWTLVSSGGPATHSSGPASGRAVMVFDVGIEKPVLFAPSIGTWEYDSGTSNWSLATLAGPSASGAMAYDQVSGKSLLFTASTTNSETWEYDGAAQQWTQLNPAASPQARERTEAVYDAGQGRVVIHGGTDWSSAPTGPVFGDTWSYDSPNGTWVEDVTTNTPQRVGAVMAYDYAGASIVSFGGHWQFPNNVIASTWLYRVNLGGNIGANYCASTLNSTGLACVMSSSGSPSISQNTAVLGVASAVPNEPGLFFYGQNQTQVPFGDGFRCIASPSFRLFPFVQAGLFGDTTLELDFQSAPTHAGPGQITPGTTWNFQYWYRDPFAGAGFNLSDGQSMVFTP